jgi:hypothetical protein
MYTCRPPYPGRTRQVITLRLSRWVTVAMTTARNSASDCAVVHSLTPRAIWSCARLRVAGLTPSHKKLSPREQMARTGYFALITCVLRLVELRAVPARRYDQSRSVSEATDGYRERSTHFVELRAMPGETELRAIPEATAKAQAAAGRMADRSRRGRGGAGGADRVARDRSRRPGRGEHDHLVPMGDLFCFHLTARRPAHGGDEPGRQDHHGGRPRHHQPVRVLHAGGTFAVHPGGGP